MNNKTWLVLIALVSIGLFALPATVSLFAGQHSFVNIDATGNQIECVKCHGDVQAELGSGYSSTTGTDGPHADFKCEYCHRIETGSSSGDNAFGIVPYTVKDGTTTYRRMYFVPVGDMEAGNYPATISGTDVLVSDTTLNGVKLEFGKGKISANVTTALPLVVGEAYDLKLAPTYNVTTGQPFDTNPSTKNSGLDLTKVNITVISSRPYYTATFYGAGSRAVNPGSNYHAASLVSCMECHGGEEPPGHYTRVVDGTDTNNPAGSAECSDCHYGYSQAALGEAGGRLTTLYAGGFGLTSKPNDTGTSEAHMEFVTTDDGKTRYQDGASNGACVACHTHVATTITYMKPTSMSFAVGFGDDGNEAITGYAVGGYTTTYSGP